MYFTATILNAPDKVVKFTLNKNQLSLAKKFNTTQTDFEVRIVVVELDNGKKEILCTSLLCIIDTTPEDLKWLYHQRWTKEEAYKILKTRIDLENFSGMTSLLVNKIFMLPYLPWTCVQYWRTPLQKK